MCFENFPVSSSYSITTMLHLKVVHANFESIIAAGIFVASEMKTL